MWQKSRKGFSRKGIFIMRRFYMTKTDFLILCGEYLIDPSLALENDEICEALRQGDDVKVEALIESQF